MPGVILPSPPSWHKNRPGQDPRELQDKFHACAWRSLSRSWRQSGRCHKKNKRESTGQVHRHFADLLRTDGHRYLTDAQILSNRTCLLHSPLSKTSLHNLSVILETVARIPGYRIMPPSPCAESWWSEPGLGRAAPAAGPAPAGPRSPAASEPGTPSSASCGSDDCLAPPRWTSRPAAARPRTPGPSPTPAPAAS